MKVFAKNRGIKASLAYFDEKGLFSFFSVSGREQNSIGRLTDSTLTGDEVYFFQRTLNLLRQFSCLFRVVFLVSHSILNIQSFFREVTNVTNPKPGEINEIQC